MSNMSHGPFKSGRNHQSLIEAAEVLASNMTIDANAFDELIDGWCRDLHISPDDADKFDDAELPESPNELPLHRAIRNLPVYAPWFWIVIIQMFQGFLICIYWSRVKIGCSF